jgi:hypothetical protein
MIKNCILLLSLDECHFFLEIELQQEGAAEGVSNPLIIGRSPFERSVGGDGLVELSADDNSNCVRNFIAALVELGRPKTVLRGAE